MDSRKEQLLNLVIENHIDTAEPVGSKFLVSEGRIDYSEATVRNELRALEEEGFLTHPHTSAGRIPTEKGYLYYVEHLNLNDLRIGKKDQTLLEKIADKTQETEIHQKIVAKTLAELSELAVLLAFSKDRIYYTGLSNLFSQPEFAQAGMAADISEVFDHCEECLNNFFDQVSDEPKIFVGDQHSFGDMLSVAAFRVNEYGLVAMLGPQRMNYKRNWALLNKAKEII